MGEATLCIRMHKNLFVSWFLPGLSSCVLVGCYHSSPLNLHILSLFLAKYEGHCVRWLVGWDVMTNLVGSMVDHRYSVAFKSMGNTIVLLVFRLLFVHVNHRRPQKKNRIVTRVGVHIQLVFSYSGIVDTTSSSS